MNIQSCEKRTDRNFMLLCFAAVMLVVVTRGLSLGYHMDVHPDEEVFFFASDSLLKSLLYGTEFLEVKPYPEGAYLFHLPFQALGLLFETITGQYLGPRFWGRISSVFYFTVAVVMGMRIMYYYMGKGLKPLVFYVLIMTFSLFFIEHSRYGVGDMISLFLLMAVIDLTIRWSENPKASRYIWAAAFVSGALGAAKYPQLYFLLIPALTWCLVYQDNRKRKLLGILLMVLVCFLGLLAFSPKAIFDWSYFGKAISREMGAYVFEVPRGGIHNTITQLLLHHILFLDFPFAFFFIAFAVIQFICNHPIASIMNILKSDHTEDVLLRFVIPFVTFGFFAYNLFVPNFTMRTYTPYLGLCALYTANIVSQIYSGGRWKKVLILMLTLFMVLRGSAMIMLLSTDATCEQYIDTVTKVIDEQDGRGRIITFRTSRIPHKPVIFGNKEIIKLEVQDFEEYNKYDIKINEGDIVIVGALDFANAQEYPLPVPDENALNVYYAWEYFKKENQEYLIGRSTPGWPYYLFGSFVKGNSFAGFTYPRIYIYYHPIEES